MDDNNYIPLKEKHINEDLPGHNEITEQQFNDTDSAPAIQIQNLIINQLNINMK